MSAFPNHYHARLVAEKDSKACTLCFKPTTTVLISQNKVDFFYVCPLHLKDEHFSSPIHPDEYKELETKKGELGRKIEESRKRVERLKPYTWNFLSSMLGSKKAEGTDQDKDKDKDKDTEKDKGKESYESAKQDLKGLEGELNEINSGISNYKFKDYTLNKDIYRMRTQNYVQSKVRAKKQQEMHKPGFFPSTPQHKVDSADQ
ncbi:uncharacterized protein AC631_01456 [Debaryomyces fabryi]|uniref:VPS4-associated protein 1 n=1 Tax=Debaryomyces fabryi TaxID=58627 RepID=A0A0V1Q2N0_9ASCO|nr:uncharacterized protein AC631_01456 [Debaryomyces fabryi]KSA02752.1 hypothetical protein AC631_01456 [Debaryomyces fabryi]CUM56075.1 unnamed protein product [Debaryomyces fabryi]